MLKKIFVGIIGPNKDKCSKKAYEEGVKLGEYLIDNKYYIINGGKQGFMEAVFKGAHTSHNYSFGCTIGIIPEDLKNYANKYADIIIPTGVGIARNIQIINSSDILIAYAGGSGTLSEIAFAWQKKKYVLCNSVFPGWASELAGKDIDNKNKDLLIPFSSINDIDKLIKSYI